MKCLFYIFTFCVIVQFIDGHVEEESDRRDAPIKISVEHDENYSNDQDRMTEESNDSSEKSEESQVMGLPEPNDQKDGQNNEDKKKVFEETMQQFAREMAAGDMADLIGSNPHTYQPNKYNDFTRRFVPQYKYTEVIQKVGVGQEENELIPEKAPPELVLVVAKESALLRPDKADDLGDDVDRKKILRSGDYWNGVWKEEVNPKSVLRTGSHKKVLGSIKAKIKAGSEFYKVVSRMKKISPRLLYIINKKKLI